MEEETIKTEETTTITEEPNEHTEEELKDKIQPVAEQPASDNVEEKEQEEQVVQDVKEEKEYTNPENAENTEATCETCEDNNEEEQANEEIQNLLEQLADLIKLKTEKNYPQFTAVSYKSKKVTGKNLYIKVDVGDEHIHVRVFKPDEPENKPEINNIQESKTKDDPIEVF